MNKESKITRITFNSSGWINPTGKIDKCIGKHLFEAQAGFGFEEWWRNPEFVQDGYQYGFLQVLNVIKQNNHDFSSLFLYTRKGNENRVVAHLKNIEVLPLNFSTDEMFSGQLNEIYRKLQSLPNVKHLLFKNGLYKKTIKRPYLNFRIKEVDIEYFEWENGEVIELKNYRFKIYPVSIIK